MGYETLIIEHEEPVLIVRLNRPDALNALNHKLLSELSTVLEDADKNESVRVIILTGSKKSLCCWSRYKRDDGQRICRNVPRQLFLQGT
jgi:enoyl-CoA hydratase